MIMVYGQRISFKPQLFIPMQYLITLMVILLWLPSTVQAENCEQARQIYSEARDTSNYSRKLTLYKEAIRLSLKNLSLAKKGVFEAKEGEVVPFEQILIELSRCGFPTMGPGGVRVTINRVRFHNILFDFDSAIIKKDSYSQLDEIGKAICSKELHGQNFAIEGHTDSIGTETYNRRLSLKRAEAVRDYLIGKFDIDGDRLKVLGHGEMRPIATNNTEEGRKKNRRVEIVKETIQ